MLSTPLNTTSVHGSATSKSNLNPLPTILPVLPALTSCSHFLIFFLRCASVNAMSEDAALDVS